MTKQHYGISETVSEIDTQLMKLEKKDMTIYEKEARRKRQPKKKNQYHKQ